MIIGPMTPRYLQETILNICIIIGAILGALGTVLWTIGGFRNWRAFLCMALGILIFGVFLKVKDIVSDYAMESPEKDSEDRL